MVCVESADGVVRSKARGCVAAPRETLSLRFTPEGGEGLRCCWAMLGMLWYREQR